LPDGIFSNQKSQFGYILEGLEIENGFIFYDHLKNVIAIWYNLWQFGVVSGHLVCFFPFLVCLDQEQAGNPGVQ
jgi:hypothetical protein